MKPSNRTNRTIIDSNGKIIADQEKNSNSFNDYFIDVGTNIEKKIPTTNTSYSDYLPNIRINKSFFKPVNKKEILEII